MTEWRCTVRTKSNYLKTVYVDAYNHTDAVIEAEAITGGECIMATPDCVSSDDSNSSTSNSSFDGAGLLLLFCLVFIAFAWKQILLITAVAALIWGIIYMIRN